VSRQPLTALDAFLQPAQGISHVEVGDEAGHVVTLVPPEDELL